MDDLNDVHRKALDATGKVIAAIGAEQWGKPTPCEGWDVRELTNHVVAGNYWAAELAAGKTIEAVGTALDGDVLGDDAAVTALLDRLLHHAHVLKFGPRSWRTKVQPDLRH